MQRSDDLTLLITKAVEQTIEEMAFTLLCLKQNLSDADLKLPQRQVQIPIVSPVEGTFILSVTPNLLLEMTENIYGLAEDEITWEMENDTLAEILNTISGRVMKEIIPLDQTYELGLPFLIQDVEKEGKSSKKGEYCHKCILESEQGELLTFSFVT